MKHKQAVKIAIKCMEWRQQVIAFDANIYKKSESGWDTPTARNAAKEYDSIEKAKGVLTQQPLEI